MGTSKTDCFTDRQIELAAIMKGMGHPARIAIIDHLLAAGQCICTDIVAEVPLAQATVSQHLKVLKTAGLIKGTIDGTSICYCLDERTFAKFQTYLAGVLTTLQQKNTCC